MELNFQTHGAGFPLIILHGLFGSLDNWQTVSRRLGEVAQVFAVDLRNHGRSPHSAGFGYELMADDVREFMDARGLKRANLLGHSIGGKVAMHFALRHPELVEKLIIVDIAPKVYPPWHDELFKAMLGLRLADYQNRAELDATLAKSIPEVAVRQFLLKNVGRDEQGAFRWKINLDSLHKNYPALNEAIQSSGTFNGPTLFLRGERSEYIRAGDLDSIKRLFPNAKLETIAAAGHWVHADQPESFIREVEKFIR